MLHRQLRSALEAIFGLDVVESALNQPQLAQVVLYERTDEFKETILGFGRLNYQEEHLEFAAELGPELTIALICSLLDTATRELISELGLNYL